MPCNCTNCDSEEECFPADHKSLQKWRKDFNGLRKQWSNFAKASQLPIDKNCCGSTDYQDFSKLTHGQFELTWISRTPQKMQCTPCGWKLEIYDTPSKIENQSKKLEEWVNNPPLIMSKNCTEGTNVFTKNCENKEHHCAVRVMPYTLESESLDCNCCCNCKMCSLVSDI